MRTHSSGFKENIANIGRQFDNMASQPVVTNYSPKIDPTDSKKIINHYQGILTGPNFSPSSEDS